MDHRSYITKTVLIGATWINAQQKVVRTRQMFGQIEEFDEEKGIVVRLNNGEEFILPPYLNALQPAEPGEYTLAETLEIIHDPDFLSVWTFQENEGQR